MIEQKYPLHVAWVAHRGAPIDTGRNAEEFMKTLISADAFLMRDEQPDIILFMSGGSERKAISLMQSEKPVLLLSIRGNNAYAAATEVMAWAVNHNRIALLSDAADASEKGLLEQWRKTVSLWKSIQGMNAGLIGSVSEWLVASEVPAEKLADRFGIFLKEIPWHTLPDYADFGADVSLMDRFKGYTTPGLEDASKVLSLLRQTIDKNGLGAIAVECFSLVQQKMVTACLALAQLNTEGIVAACEGDLASMAGMILSGKISGTSTWMANTTYVKKNSIIVSHCTVAFDRVDLPRLTTHYETDCSLAVKGVLTAREVTLFRLSDNLEQAFIAEGRVVDSPEMDHACRTQVEIELPAEALHLLQTRPLGNHLIVAPGKHAEMLRLVCYYKGIEIIK